MTLIVVVIPKLNSGQALTKVRIYLILNPASGGVPLWRDKFRMTIALSLNLSEITPTTE